jgi:UDP-N-acetylmuramoyl-tripeptide--D-alanyl-D-alanine ligase
MLKTDTQTISNLFNTDCKNVAFSGVSINSKDCQNKLFIAIIGKRFNAHQFAQEAQENGAKAIVASEPVNCQLPVILVENTTLALGEIARYHRQNTSAKIIAITGSNGKTTCKNMLANILNIQASCLKTKGNLNNHIGVALTLLNLEKKHQFAVIEMGANHLGEIAYLCQIALPDISLVTNTYDAHIGEFGGFENLVTAKNEIYVSGSTHIVNARSNFKGDIYFGNKTKIFASNIHQQQFCLHLNQKKALTNLKLIGKHNIENALAASACAYALNIDISTITQGLEATLAEPGRLEIIKNNQQTIINDSYNANPKSSEYALKILTNYSGKRVVILGEMAELGNKSKEMHIKIGKYAKSLNIDYIYSIGAGAQDYQVKHFNDKKTLINTLKTHSDATLLFKGSRTAKLEAIINKICV